MEEGIEFVDYSKPENLPKISEGDIAFGGAYRYMIKSSQIPQVDYKWSNLFSKTFYGVGEGKILDVEPKDSYSESDNEKYWNFIQSVLRSFSPKHQHKEKFVAYMFSLWLKDYSIKDVSA